VGAWEAGLSFAKVFAYYLLLVTVISTPRRFRIFLRTLILLIVASTALATLQYNGIIDIKELKPVLDIDYDTGNAPLVFVRLRSVGIFNDPNDFSIIHVMGMVLALWAMGESRSVIVKAIWAGFIAFLGYGLILTQSRGGLLSLLAGFLFLAGFRFGWRRAALITLPILALASFVLSGRQTQITLSDGTGLGRLQLWWQGLDLYLQAPLFGIGVDQYGEHVGFVGHNSYVHSLVELGLFGGTCFVGCYYSAFLGLSRSATQLRGNQESMRRLRGYLMAVIVAYAVGLFSLSRVYVISTYIAPGLATVYMRQLGSTGLRFDARYGKRLVLIGLFVLISFFIITRVLVKWK